MNTTLSPDGNDGWTIWTEAGAVIGHLRHLSRNLFVIDAEGSSPLAAANQTDFKTQRAAMERIGDLTGGSCRIGPPRPAPR